MRYIFTRTPNSLVDSAIRGFDSGGVSHVGIESPLVPGDVVHTTLLRGVHVLPRQEFESKREIVRVCDLPLLDEQANLEWLREQVGKGYDIMAVIGMPLLRDWQDEDRWYCFELAMASALRGGYELLSRHSEIGGRLCLELMHAWSEPLTLENRLSLA